MCWSQNSSNPQDKDISSQEEHKAIIDKPVFKKSSLNTIPSQQEIRSDKSSIDPDEQEFHMENTLLKITNFLAN